MTAMNTLVMGFAPVAIDVRDNSPSLFIDDTSTIKSSILYASDSPAGPARVNGGDKHIMGYLNGDPRLVNVRNEPNPDPRPMLDSPALKIGAGTAPPSDGVLDTSAQYVGAFADSNWLEEWTFFGVETDYDAREADAR